MVEENRGTIGGGSCAHMGDLHFTGVANFSDNNATGAMTLHSSVMYASSTETVYFNRNTAK